MKKILVLMGLALLVVCLGKPLAASTNASYKNLIDYNKLSYDSSTGIISSTQQFELIAGKTYTIIATNNFFGSATANDYSAVDRVDYKTHSYNSSNTSVNTVFKNDLRFSGYYVASTIIKENCTLFIDDFLTRGNTLGTLRKNEIIFYEGTENDFEGFRSPEYLDGYSSIGSELELYTNYDNPILLDTIINSLKLYDNIDGFTDNISVVSDEYTNRRGIGKFAVTCKGIDAAKNEKLLRININVVDITAPVISGESVIEWNFTKDAPTIEDLKKIYQANDNVDGNVSSQIYILNSDLESYTPGVGGTFNITLAAKDTSGNIGQKNITVKAIDTTPPTLILKDFTINLSELTIDIIDNITEKLIVTNTDDSGKTSISFSAGELMDNGYLTGVFEVSITSKDPSGNKTTKTAKVTVIDDISPEFYIKSDYLNTDAKKPLTHEEVKAKITTILRKKGILCDEVHLIASDYFANDKKTGTYTVKYFYTYNNQINYGTTDIIVSNTKSFNYAYLALLIIPVGAVACFVIFRKRKNLKRIS